LRSPSAAHPDLPSFPTRRSSDLDVYRRLLEKLEEARRALGGQVFDVLGKLQFEGKPLRELLIEAIRYGERPEVRARLEKAVESRSEEHTSELQSRENLVCRLLLE